MYSSDYNVPMVLHLQPDWSPEDLDRALKTVPMTGAEIVAAGLLGGWEGAGITDGSSWVHELRSKRRAKRSY